MSVIVRDEDGSIILFCKGADSIIFDRLSKNGKMYLEATTRHLNEYGEAGLRTLALAYRKLDEQEYFDWNNKFQKAKTAVGPDRDAMLEHVSDIMERELILDGSKRSPLAVLPSLGLILVVARLPILDGGLEMLPFCP
ncbi:probable phospholipid-transporting ATPase 7 [Cajanus cajan]|uniref:probable phospholipid-transporting ATPase 7 n=1 Tax=Cajanus cajan TaxID=3821 RepID=UPI00098DC365|nr:probable phospholipid-transporting ATPase 7 [Cajanus cajan]